MNTPLLYRSGVGIVIEYAQLFFCAQRLDYPEAWQMPQGGIEKNEKPLEAAYRETKEETSITSLRLIQTTDDWLYYDIPHSLQQKLWNNRYIGQKQIWFHFQFTGSMDEINIHTPQPEFSQYRWLSPQEIITNAVPFKKNLYHCIFKKFQLF